ncbi:MAG: BlaI/MecI/CopY family transcriptional regulator [Planctomycetaceae bacterium]|nr:BlaI/MecI/CopY family transcriptional regulator [Planctomycetaceae bacterium]
MAESRLTHYELELMDVLWRIGEGTVQDVCDVLERDLAYTTVMTTLNLLANKKGVLKRTKVGRAFVYRPLFTRDEVSRTILGDLKQVLFADRLPTLMLNMINEQGISEADADAIRAALDQLEGDG